MEHGRGIVPGDQEWFARLAFHEIRIIRDDCRDVAIDAFLRAVGIHPCARAFAGARVRIEIPETDVFPGSLVSYFPNANVGMGHRHVCDGCEVEIEKFARDPADAFAYLLEL